MGETLFSSKLAGNSNGIFTVDSVMAGTTVPNHELADESEKQILTVGIREWERKEKIVCMRLDPVWSYRERLQDKHGRQELSRNCKGG